MNSQRDQLVSENVTLMNDVEAKQQLIGEAKDVIVAKKQDIDQKKQVLEQLRAETGKNKEDAEFALQQIDIGVGKLDVGLVNKGVSHEEAQQQCDNTSAEFLGSYLFSG